ncbi:MAG TPA: hypothetical protein PKN75_07465 [Bacteroidia bacterium]|nr:hypothetical protein [Bacteroidia bacterium]HNU33416.1 hypothetical protein [Bacteroidia bacterium]
MSTRSDYIPGNEEDFNDFVINFTEKVVANAATWAVPDAAKTELVAATDDWTAKYAAGNPEADPTSAQRQAKNDARKTTTTVIRTVVNEHLRNNPLLTNADLTSLNLTVPDTTRTRVPVPNHAPQENIEKIQHLLHTLRITDPLTPDSKAKPQGLARINVYRYVGTTAPTAINQYQLYGSATKALFASEFTEDEVGKKAWYITQYENTRGERGPLSDSVSAVIA